MTLLVLAGCGSSRVFESTVPASGGLLPRTAGEIIDRLPDFPEALSSLSAEALVSVSHPEENGRFTARIAYRRGDSMLVRVRFPLGIEGARVLVTADSAFVFDRIKNRVISGRPDDISDLLPVAVATTNLVETATGFILPDRRVSWTVTRDSLRYRLDSPDGRFRFIIDPSVWRVAYAQVRDADGTIEEQRWYTDYRMFDGVLLPGRMNLSRPKEDTRLSMALRQLDTNPAALDFHLGLKSDTEHYRLPE